MILNGRQLIEILPLAELYSAYFNHERLEVFAKKGRYCATCFRRGTLLLVTEEVKGKNIGRQHVDLYTDDFVLMTVDHIVPFSLSADDTLENKQPMCEPCNHAKGSKTISNEQLSLNRKNARPIWADFTTIRLLVPNIHSLLDDYSVLDSTK